MCEKGVGEGRRKPSGINGAGSTIPVCEKVMLFAHFLSGQTVRLIKSRTDRIEASHGLEQGSTAHIRASIDPEDFREKASSGRLMTAAVMLCTISRLRRELEDAFSGASFLPPTTLEGKCVAGLQWHGRTVFAEAADFMHAYHRLWRHAVRRFL